MSEKLALLKKKIEELREEECRLINLVKEEEKQILLKDFNISLPSNLFRVEFSNGNTDGGPLGVVQYFLEDFRVPNHRTNILYICYVSEDVEDDLELETYSDAYLIDFMKEYRLFLSPEEAIANAIKEMRESLSEQ